MSAPRAIRGYGWQNNSSGGTNGPANTWGQGANAAQSKQAEPEAGFSHLVGFPLDDSVNASESTANTAPVDPKYAWGAPKLMQGATSASSQKADVVRPAWGSNTSQTANETKPITVDPKYAWASASLPKTGDQSEPSQKPAQVWPTGGNGTSQTVKESKPTTVDPKHAWGSASLPKAGDQSEPSQKPAQVWHTWGNGTSQTVNESKPTGTVAASAQANPAQHDNVGWGHAATATVPPKNEVASPTAPAINQWRQSSSATPNNRGGFQPSQLNINVKPEGDVAHAPSSKTHEHGLATPHTPMDPSVLEKLIEFQLNDLSESDKSAIVYPDGQGGDNLRSSMLWQEFSIAPELMRGLAHMGFRYPSGIQGKALPQTLTARKHAIVQSQNGTGKTGTYLITILSVIDYSVTHCQAMVMVNTHELALQVAEVGREMGKFLPGLRVAVAIPGTEVEKVPGPVAAQLVIGTPGTLMRWSASQNADKIDLSKLKIFVMDEADQLMESEAFYDIVRLIKKKLKRECQILLFSATFDQEVRDYAHEFLGSGQDVKEIFLSVEELALKNVRQFKMYTPTFEDKLSALFSIYRIQMVTACLVFCKTRDEAHKLANCMREQNHSVGVLTGLMTPQEREKEIERFRESETRALISTNLCSRGLDIQHLNLVVNWDQPKLPKKEGESSSLRPDFETYLHRVGRSGRFGRFGLAINFISNQFEDSNLAEIEKYFGITVPAVNYLDIDDLDKIANPRYKKDPYFDS